MPVRCGVQGAEHRPRRGLAAREGPEDGALTLTPMNRSLSTIHESKNTNALLQQKSTEASVVLIFWIACRYR